MNLGRLVWLIGFALLVMIANVVCSILYMIVYSYAINPGHDEQFYNAHIQNAAPYCSIVAGIPLMFIAGWRVSKWWNGENALRSAFIVWLTYAVIDVSIIAASGMLSQIGVLVGISMVTKLAAVFAEQSLAGGTVELLLPRLQRYSSQNGCALTRPAIYFQRSF